MAEEVMNGSDQMRRARDKRLAVLAARLMQTCLGVPAEPGFEVNSPSAADTARRSAPPYGSCLFKDVFDCSVSGEESMAEVLIVDEQGLIKAASRDARPIGEALALAAKLPLEVSPRAQQWVMDSLGEPVAAARGIKKSAIGASVVAMEIKQTC